MFLYYMELTLQSMLLCIEAQAVVGLRVRKLAKGGPAAHFEAYGMVAEKTDAMSEALATFASGGSVRSVICRLRTQVQANEARLLDTRKRHAIALAFQAARLPHGERDQR